MKRAPYLLQLEHTLQSFSPQTATTSIDDGPEYAFTKHPTLLICNPPLSHRGSVLHGLPCVKSSWHQHPDVLGGPSRAKGKHSPPKCSLHAKYAGSDQRFEPIDPITTTRPPGTPSRHKGPGDSTLSGKWKAKYSKKVIFAPFERPLVDLV